MKHGVELVTGTRRRGAWLAALVLLAACGGGDGGPSTPSSPAPTPTPGLPAPTGTPAPCEGTTFSSTWEGIQKTVFTRNGCTEQACHGSGAAGGLDLSPDVAYRNIFDADALESPLKRIQPGDKDRSWLWLKLAAKTRPGSVNIVGAPMPVNLPAISEQELELLRVWIYAGAPEAGTVPGTAELLDACLPEPEPIAIKPLDPPAPEEGVQFVLPTVDLPPGTEQEFCFATTYDLTDRVPDWAKDPTGRFFRYSGQELRQDPQSHHLLLLLPDLEIGAVRSPAFGTWQCAGGPGDGQACDPLDPAACGEGFCRSEIRPAVGCIGYGPPGASFGVFARQLGGAQATNAYQRLRPGVFGQAPLRAIVYWNSHAFNLTNDAHRLNGRLNFFFTADQRYPVQPIFDITSTFLPSAAPFTIATYCADHVLPQGARLFGITSHTHRRGKRFWVNLPDGTEIFENTIYNDPNKRTFDPPLEFDSPDPAQRTLKYCATYNNGVADDGSPDPETVTRRSRTPDSASLVPQGVCSPVACVSGRVGAACNGVGDDRTCDSAPGANDGFCDACRITPGESTENEMFILIGQTYIDERFPQPSADGPLLAGLASIAP